MSKVIIGALVAAVIAFVYQAMSWMVLPVHANTLKYTSNQDAIIAALSQNLTETGVYGVPNVPPGTAQEKQQELWDSMSGKPSAVVHYTASTQTEMGGQMVMGFVLNLVAALIAAFVVSKAGGSFGTRLMVVLGFAVFTVFQSSLMMANWWKTPMHYLSGEIIDALVGWALSGAWLAWWFGRKQAATAS